MSEGRFLRLQRLFDRALEIEIAARPDFAAFECADDPQLGIELLALLAHATGNFLGEQDLDQLSTLGAAALPSVGEPSRTVGPYTLHEVLGDGGMGRVYRATRLHDGIEQEAAIKVIRGELLTPGLARRFSVERRLLAALDHPGICRFLDAGTLADGMPYVVMERVHGLPLLDYCNNAHLGIHARVRLLRMVCAAVAYAHSSLVIHRDIKPSNVLVDAHGQPKLLDFGIAKSLSQVLDETSPAERFLTPSSAAPEQLGGGPAGVGCDIYALGALAYELLCGRAPFDFSGLRASEIEHLLLKVPPALMSQRVPADALPDAFARACTDVRGLRAQLRGDIDAIVAKCLRKEPAERYPTVAQLDDDLARVLARQPISIRADDDWYRARKFVERHRLGVGLGSALALTLAGSAVVFVQQSLQVERERQQAVLERNVAREVVDVLKDSFSAADPAGVLGADARASDVLAAAQPRIEALRDSQPGAYAELATVIGEVEFELGLDTKAGDLSRKGLQAARTAGWQGAQLRPMLILETRIRTYAGDYPQAEELLSEIARIDGAQFRADRALYEGRLLIRLNRPDDGFALLRQAVAATAESTAQDDIAIGVRWELAGALDRNDRTEESLQVFDETLRWMRQSLPEGHAEILKTQMRRLSASLSMPSRRQESVDEAAKVAAAMAKAYGADSSMAATSLSVYGILLKLNNRYAEAIPVLESTLAIWEKQLGPAHAETSRARFNLAAALTEWEGLTSRAEALYRGAIASAEQSLGTTSNPALYMKLGLARQLDRAERPLDALELLLAADTVIAFENARSENRRSFLLLLQQVLAAPDCKEGKPRCLAGKDLLQANAKVLSTPPPSS